jgi:hypothetical protein
MPDHIAWKQCLHPVIQSCTCILLGLIVGLVLTEFVFTPSYILPNSIKSEVLPGTFVSDPVIGWRHLEGARNYSPTMREAIPFRATFWPLGNRATRIDARPRGKEIILAGCSFVEGLGLGDEQTFAWKLQEKMPEYTITNLGVSGYGTLHSKLAIERYLKQSGNPQPAAIIYGFADFHSDRNVKNRFMQRYWSEPGSFPYCDAEGCRTWSGKAMNNFFQRSRVYSIIENWLDSRRAQQSPLLMETITIDLIKEMAANAQAANSIFIVAPVSLNDQHWFDHFRQLDIPTINCLTPTMRTKDYTLVGGHPNEKWSETFADCLSTKLQPLIASPH